MFEFHKVNHSVPAGLTYRPTISPELDDMEDFYGPKRAVPQEFSKKNQAVLAEVVKSLPNANLFVEIGVERRPNSPTCSTQILLGGRPDGCAYAGIDLRDCAYLNQPLKNMRFIRTDCRNQKAINTVLDELHPEIDLLFIDGDHSVEWCLTDWQLVNRLAVGGAVVLHDTNVHPGPLALLDAVDPEYFDVQIHCQDDPNDWGIAVLRLKKKLPCQQEKKRCFMVQGPLTYAKELTPMLQKMPGQVLWSTWDSEPDDLKQLLTAAGIEVVTSPIPAEDKRGFCNANLQFASTDYGLQAAKARGFTHVFRIRHDIILDNPQKLLNAVGDNVGFPCHYRWYLMDYIVSGPIDKLLVLYAARFPVSQTKKMCTEHYMKRRYIHWFGDEPLQYLLPLIRRYGITATWLRQGKDTINPLNRYYLDPALSKKVSYPSPNELRK